ncbi:glycoside hydrolase family 47 protein [Atractiella rhizophila]|nr:glycoside hydrolase family 47 protein [Atractiella rhizophila]
MSESNIRQRKVPEWGASANSGTTPKAGSPKDSDKKDSPATTSTPAQPETEVPGWLLILGFIGLFGIIYYGTSFLIRSSLPVDELTGKPITEKQEAILEAFKWSWSAYERDAWGWDEYHPLSRKGSNLEGRPEGQGIGYTIVDSIDSLLLFGMEEEYQRARAWVEKKLNFDVDGKTHAFEATIRILACLTRTKLYLDKAIDLADRLMPIFDTPSGIPLSYVELKTRTAIADPDNQGFSSIAEAGTLQLEFKYLSELTGDPKYWKAVEKVMHVVNGQPKKDGLVPIFLSPQTGSFVFSDIRLGSRADSYYEYLLKQYLQTAKTEPMYRDMYDEAMGGVKEHLVKITKRTNTMHTTELQPARDRRGRLTSQEIYKQDHLVCFLGGLLILGVTEGEYYGDEHSQIAPDDFYLGNELVKTCSMTYFQSRTGLGAEIVHFLGEKDKPFDERDWYIKRSVATPIDARNILRPETVESLFVAYRITGNPRFREWGWEIFNAFDEHCRVETGGYSGIKDVEEIPPIHDDKMETFWLSETLKYLYLLFSDETVVPLDKYVFNTEAHILPVFKPTVVKDE